MSINKLMLASRPKLKLKYKSMPKHIRRMMGISTHIFGSAQCFLFSKYRQIPKPMQVTVTQTGRLVACMASTVPRLNNSQCRCAVVSILYFTVWPTLSNKRDNALRSCQVIGARRCWVSGHSWVVLRAHQSPIVWVARYVFQHHLSCAPNLDTICEQLLRCIVC